MAISADDLDRLRCCVDLAREALDDGAPDLVVDGPAAEFTDTMKDLYETKFRR